MGVLFPLGMAEGWLTFESEGEKRRVYPVSPRWTEYSDDELAALCRMAPLPWAEQEPAVR